MTPRGGGRAGADTAPCNHSPGSGPTTWPASWPTIGLPDNRMVLLPRGLGSFSTPGGRTISHGGIGLEEVIVPFVRISKRTP